MFNIYFHSNFSFQKAKYLHIKEISTFNICFLLTKDNKRSWKRDKNFEGKITSWRK